MMKAASLRSKSIQILDDIKSGTRDGVDNLKSVISEAQLLDYLFAEWTQDMPMEWVFLTRKRLCHSNDQCHNNKSCVQYDDFFHSYTTHHHATIWNRYRAVRLLINSIQMRLLAVEDQHTFGQSDFDISTQSKTCEEVISCLSTDLCRSIPSFHHFDTGFSTSTSGIIICPESDLKPTMAVLLAWPISIAVSIEEVPLNQREWLKCRLQAVNKVIGCPTLDALSRDKLCISDSI
jgi:hypothetical protein